MLSRATVTLHVTCLVLCISGARDKGTLCTYPSLNVPTGAAAAAAAAAAASDNATAAPTAAAAAAAACCCHCGCSCHHCCQCCCLPLPLPLPLQLLLLPQPMQLQLLLLLLPLLPMRPPATAAVLLFDGCVARTKPELQACGASRKGES
jgi:hypothetical protein